MPRVLLGFNKTFTIKRRQRAVSASGAILEGTTTTVAAAIPGTVQPHVLSNLPPPTQRPKTGGLLRIDEFRLWLGDESVVDVRLDDYIEEDGTSPLKTYRVMAVLDDAGRGHHQYFRVETYSQESENWLGDVVEGV